MKKFILQNYYTAQIVILNVRVYILTNDYNFIEDEARKERLNNKIFNLNSKILELFFKIEDL